MEIIELKQREDIANHKTLKYVYPQFGKLLKELRKKDIPTKIIEPINEAVTEINTTGETGKNLQKLVSQKHSEILELVKKELKLIPKNNYTYLWMVIGMAAFGLPVGVVFGLSMDNMGLMATGLPVGMGIGILLGLSMDIKVKNEGRQLDLDNHELQF